MKEFCPHCHQSIQQNKQVFSKALGEILLKAACAYPYGKPFHLQNDLKLTKSEYCNFQKLRYFGLVEKSYEEGVREGGKWKLTSLTRYFINGSRIPRVKWTFNNQVVEASKDDLITLSEAIGSFEVPAQWAEKALPMTNLMQPSLFETI